MTNGNVRLEYDLSTGRANFYWQNSLKINGFYSGAGLYTGDTLDAYITGTVYSTRTWTVSGNEVEITLTGQGLPTMKQVFILAKDNSFLTRMEMHGNGLHSRWMGAVVMDRTGGVDLGVYNDNRALIMPFDNDSWTFLYNGQPINNTGTSYEVGAFYDNTSRNGLVVGSVTHDKWKTGVHFQGANNKLDILNVWGGVTSSDTRDVLPHGLVSGNPIVSPTVFVGFDTDWRRGMEAYADANTALVQPLAWKDDPPFGWNSWYAYGFGVSYSNATLVSSFVKTNLQANTFHSWGVVYINLDSGWSYLSDLQLTQFANYCHSNGQKAGIYSTPFIYWGSAAQGSNATMTGSSYKWSASYLRTPGGGIQINPNNGGIALDPTHPGTRQLISYYIDYFTSKGFDYLKLDFLSQGALEGAHYDTNVTTGIQAYNQAMEYLASRNNGRMFLNLSIAPIFPYQYAHSRRLTCDTSTKIGETGFQLNGLTYGWWQNGRIYQYTDPDIMRFSGGTAYENQSRLISCAISGTVFLNGDDLAGTSGQALARNCLINPSINEVARAGVAFWPVEGNTGTNASNVFVRQDENTWYVAVFNYTASSVNRTLSLSRLGISGSYKAVDLWSGAVSTVSGPTWTVSLGARQAKLFRLGSGNASAVGPSSQTVFPGASVTFSTAASGAPPFAYVWRRNGIAIGQNANVLTISPVASVDAGTYTVEITGGSGSITNSATLTVLQAPLKWAAGNGTWDFASTGMWTDNLGTSLVYQDGMPVLLDDSASGSSSIEITLNDRVAPASLTVSNSAKDYIISGAGSITSSTALLKSGSGKLTLLTGGNISPYIGIKNGTLQFGDGSVSGDVPNAFITNNAVLAINRSDVYTLPSLSAGYPALRGGPGVLKQIGSGKLVFNYQYVFGAWLSTPGQGLYVGPGSIAETVAYNPVGPVTLEGGTLSAAGGAGASYQSWVLCGGVTVLSNPQTAVITNNMTVTAFSGIELRDPTVFDVAPGATNGIDLLVPAVLTHSYWEYGNWGTLLKTGAGTMVLSGQNLFQGAAVVTGGTLALERPGSIGPSGFPVTVRAGGRFSGDGTIYRNVFVESGGVLAPGGQGMCLGSLEVHGDLSLGGSVVCRINGTNMPTSDLLVVTNNLAYGGTLIVTNLGPTLHPGDSFKLFSKPGAGTFKTLDLPTLGSGLQWTNKLGIDGSLAVVQSVSPWPTNLAAFTTTTNIVIQWPESHTGWMLQAQTNTAGTGLASDWHDIPASSGTNRWMLEPRHSAGNVFFRLILK